jgi:hypothetical protein
MHLSDAHHSRKIVAGACMVVAPVVTVMWQLVGEGDTAAAMSLLQGLNESAGILIPFAFVSFGFSIGMACWRLGSTGPASCSHGWRYASASGRSCSALGSRWR